MEARFTKYDILGYQKAFGAGPEFVGGKAWAVSRLARYGFRVPAGCILAKTAYEKFLLHAGIDISFFHDNGNKTSDTFLQNLLSLHTAIVNAPFPEHLRLLIRNQLAAHDLKAPLVLRSSAIGEDGKTHTQAGIYKSRLHVQGIDAICQTVKDIWASLWTPAAMAYREQRKIEGIPSCAVLFNQMVPVTSTASFSAGVAFTCDPVSGQRDIVVINATSGWADKLADGRVNAEQWRIDLRERPLQAHRQVTLPGGALLSHGQALELAETARRILWAFGDGQDPIDIEWVMAGENIWIVQARPVTFCRSPQLPGERCLPRVWSNANIVESMPGVLRTISWEIIKTNLDQILYAAYRLGGYHIPSGLEPARRFKGRIMINQTQLQFVSHDAYAIPPSELNHMLGGHQGEIAYQNPPALSLLKRLKCLLRGMRLIRRARTFQKDFTERCEAKRLWLKAYAHKNWSIVDNAGLAAALRQLIDQTLEFGLHYAVCDINGDSTLLNRFLAKSFKDKSHATAAGLMAGTGAILSAEQSFRIETLARTALNSPIAKQFLLMESESTSWQALPVDDPFRVELDTFLSEFGHRCVYEAEIANPRWEEDPAYIIEQIRSFIKSGLNGSPRSKASEIQACSMKRLKQLPSRKRRIAFRLLKKARASAIRREAGKSTFSCHIMPLRAIILEIGRRLVEGGRIKQLEDVFDLTSADLLAYLDGKWGAEGADGLIADRQSERSAWTAQSVPHVVVEPVNGSNILFAQPRYTASKADFIGIAASPGIAEGRVKIIRHPDEATHLRHGDILAAPALDAGWTPLFLKASAVISEVGGYLSHGAIVSREFGLPAVVNIPGLLANLVDDQVVRVDGNRGEVIKLSNL